MNKFELIYELGRKVNLQQCDIESVLNAAIKIITAELKQGGKVQIVGFGTFSVRDRAAHKCLTPRTQEPIEIPAHKLPHFKPGKSLKAKVNA